MTTPAWGLFVGTVVASFLGLFAVHVARVRADVGAGSRREALLLRVARDRTEAYLLNASLAYGLLVAVLVAAAWWTDVPTSALGLGADAVGARELLVGAGLAVAIYVGHEALAAAIRGAGGSYDGRVGGTLVPEDRRDWLLVLVVVLPVSAAFEEALFRGVLVGVLPAGFGLPTWPLVVASSVLFGLVHGGRGPAGRFNTAAAGLAFAAAFVFTGSLLVVLVAHYLVNVLEIGLTERLGARDPF